MYSRRRPPHARAVLRLWPGPLYAEMALAGFTVVGEFHYLHHGPGGVRYDDPNAMGRALLAAAREAGVKVVLLDTCYLEAGPGRPLEGAQLRFGDGDVESWAARVADMPGSRLSDRQRCPDRRHVWDRRASWCGGPLAAGGPARGGCAGWPNGRRTRSVPLHFHCSEQPAENEQVLAAYGATPVALLAEAGPWARARSPCTLLTSVRPTPRRWAARAPESACAPTTERDLADGIGPARQLLTARLAAFAR